MSAISPITGFVGLNGSGKSLAAVEFSALPSWRRGIPVVSNVELYPHAAGFDDDLYVPLGGDWRAIARLGEIRTPDGEVRPDLSHTGGRPCTLLLDEIQACFPARQHNALPPELVRVINQLRKQRVTVAWTSPAWEQADAELRRVTRMVVHCRGSRPDCWVRAPEIGWRPPVARNLDTGKRLLAPEDWRPNRLFTFKAYSAEDYEAFTQEKLERIGPLWRRRYWRQRHQAHLAYDTGAHVHLLSHLDSAGVCVVCDGTKSRHRCRCGEGHPSRPVPEAPSEAAPQGRPAVRFPG